MSAGGFLARWSKRKLAQAIEAQGRPAEASALEAEGAGASFPSEVRAPVAAGPQPAGAAAGRPGVETGLPAVEGLTLASDFTAFLKEEVSESLRRQALTKLFADPHFNRMDGLDIYIDDYSVPVPIPPEMMGKLKHAREWLTETRDEGEAQQEPVGTEHEETPVAGPALPGDAPAAEVSHAAQEVAPPAPDPEGAPASATSPPRGHSAD